MTRKYSFTSCLAAVLVAFSLTACSGSKPLINVTPYTEQQTPVADDAAGSDGADESNELPEDPAALEQPAPETGQALPPIDVNAAREALNGLTVRGLNVGIPKYDREEFGKAWSDDVTVAGGHNGCDTRNDILARDLKDVSFKPARRQCVVLTGALDDPYTGQHIDFKRGKQTSNEVPIDHVVALGDAWYAGAYQWDADKRRNFANDPINLQATNQESNTQKSAQTAATWLPPNEAYRCEYVGRQITIKSTYQLSVTPAEKTAMDNVLNTCAG